MLDSLPVRPPRVGIKVAEAENNGKNVGLYAKCLVHQGTNGTPVRDESHLLLFRLGLRGVLLAGLASYKQGSAG